MDPILVIGTLSTVVGTLSTVVGVMGRFIVIQFQEQLKDKDKQIGQRDELIKSLGATLDTQTNIMRDTQSNVNRMLPILERLASK